MDMTEANRQASGIYRMGSVGVFVQLAIVFVFIGVAVILGPKPTTAGEYFLLLKQDRLAAILRDDFTSLIMIALYLLTIPGLYLSLKQVNRRIAGYAAVLTVIGVTVAFSTHSGFSLLYLGDRYLAATTEAERAGLMSAAEAVIAANMWNSTGAYMAGILLQGAGVVLSCLMWRSEDFSKITAFTGIAGNGLDLTQHVFHPFIPAISSPIQMIMSPFYMAWFLLLGRDLYRLAKRGLAG